MSSLFEAYGLTRQSTETDTPQPESTEEHTVKEKETKGLSPAQSQLVSLLEPIRELDWNVDIPSRLSGRERSAALLYRRGESVDPCAHCKRKNPWSSCVVFPIYNEKSMFYHACASCLYYHKANSCSLRLEFEEQGGQAWDSALTEAVRSRGGLRRVLDDETTITTAPPAPMQATLSPKAQKRIAVTENAEPQTQTLTTTKKPRVSTPVVSSPRPQVKSRFDGDTLRWPVTPTAWNDVGKLNFIAKDLKSFLAITET
ncbi:hypothetical protein BJX70DRAFT_404181 [Aspergillus crustosus]